MLHFIGKQAYKLELPKWWKIHNIFYLSLLEYNIAKKEQIDKKVMELDFEASNSKVYKLKAIWDSVVYANKGESHLPGLYYLIVWKKYFKEENT